MCAMGMKMQREPRVSVIFFSSLRLLQQQKGTAEMSMVAKHADCLRRAATPRPPTPSRTRALVSSVPGSGTPVPSKPETGH